LSQRSGGICSGLLILLTIGCSASRSTTVVVAYASGTASLVPEAVASEELAASILSNVYEPLVSFEGNLALQPGLADSWYTEDERTWVFKLRQGIRFHDGRPLDATSVVQSIERARTNPASKVRGELTDIESVAARGPQTVIVRTRMPLAALPPRLESVPVWVPPRDGGDRPVGTGPYTVQSWTPRGDTILEAFEGYSPRSPLIKRLEFRVIPSLEDRLNELRRGHVDLVVDVPPDRTQSLEGSSVRVLSLKGLRVIFLGMDCASLTNPSISNPKNPFRDPRVRKAVSLAIDRQSLVNEALGGHAEVIEQLIAPGVFGFNPRLAPVSSDIALARRLLSEAGFPKGFAVDLDFMPKKYLAMPKVVAVLAKQLGIVGIEVRPRPQEAETFFQRIERHDTAFYLMGWIASSGDAGVSYGYLAHSPIGGLGAENGAGYSNPRVDSLLDRSTGELRVGDRQQLLMDVGAAIHEDKPMIPLYRQEDIYAVGPRLGFDPHLGRMIRGVSMTLRKPETLRPR
jgi:peptide/nickel transport system substrate-binding protein